MAALKSLDKDHWAEEWSKIGLGYEAKGDAAAKAGASGKELPSSTCTRSTPAASAAIRRRCSPGKLAGVSAFAPHVPQGGEAFRPAARDHRSAVRRQEARRLSAEAAGRRQAAGRHALGRRRRLEGGPAEDRQGDHGGGPRLAHHRHAGQRRESGAVWRSRGRAHLFRLARLSADARRHRRHARRGLGRQLRRLLGGAARLHRGRPHQGRGVPRRQRALRLPARVAGAGLHHRRRDLSVRRAEPARRARPRHGREDASRNSSTPWRRCRSRPWACSTSRRRRCSASTASSTTRRRSPTSIC